MADWKVWKVRDFRKEVDSSGSFDVIQKRGVGVKLSILANIYILFVYRFHVVEYDCDRNGKFNLCDSPSMFGEILMSQCCSQYIWCAPNVPILESISTCEMLK